MASDKEDVVLLLAIGLILVAAGGYVELVRQEVDGEYTPVSAEIKSSEKVTTEPGLLFGSATTYTPRITYRYSYEGTNYTSSTICSGEHTPMGAIVGCTVGSDKSGVESMLESYPEGDQVTAYVNPSDPSEAYLNQQGYAFLNWLVIVLGIAFVAAAEHELTTEEPDELDYRSEAVQRARQSRQVRQGYQPQAPPQNTQEVPIMKKATSFMDDVLKVVISVLFLLVVIRLF